jgi:AraC-like DNA-binding protein
VSSIDGQPSVGGSSLVGSIELTASKHLHSVVAFLASNGEPVEPLLDRAGLPSHCLDDPKTLVPTAALWRFRELAADGTGLPNLTLTAMERLELPELGTVGRAVAGGPTLLGMIRGFQRLARTESSTAIIDLVPRSTGDVFFSTRFALRQETGEWQAELYLLAWMLKIVWLVDPKWRPGEIWCRADGTPHRLRAIESLATRPRFNRPCIGFPIPLSMLALPRASRGSGDRPLETAEEFLWSTAPSGSAAGAVQQVIRAYADDDWLTLEQTADVLGTSLRTIQRDLSAEGTTFSEILEESRAESAASLLVETDASLSEIARRLGYSNLSNFNRAFRRWAAVSPRNFRAQRHPRPDRIARDVLSDPSLRAIQ